MSLSPQIVDVFLDRQGKDRQWLADQIGAARGTVNNWFSANEFPHWAALSIQRLINECENSDIAALKFTLEQWKRIQAAANLSGAKSVDEYIVAVIAEEASRLAAKERESLNEAPGD